MPCSRGPSPTVRSVARFGVLLVGTNGRGHAITLAGLQPARHGNLPVRAQRPGAATAGGRERRRRHGSGSWIRPRPPSPNCRPRSGGRATGSQRRRRSAFQSLRRPAVLQLRHGRGSGLFKADDARPPPARPIPTPLDGDNGANSVPDPAQRARRADEPAQRHQRHPAAQPDRHRRHRPARQSAQWPARPGAITLPRHAATVHRRRRRVTAASSAATARSPPAFR